MPERQEPAGVSVTLPPELVDQVAERVVELLEERRANQPEPWIGVDEAAEHAGLNRQGVYDRVARGDFPHRKEGHRLVFRRSEIDAWIEGRR